MSDRKYRQRGYQDDTRDRERERPALRAPRPPAERAPGRQLQDAAGPKTPNLMASHEVFRCARCGQRLATPVEQTARCSKCSVGVHSCINCVSFDTSARFECDQPVPQRVSPKDDSNLCALFEPRTTVERQTGTTPAPAASSTPASGTSSGSTSASSSARQAFDDLFK